MDEPGFAEWTPPTTRRGSQTVHHDNLVIVADFWR